MCDYSLQHAKSRPAVVGEKLTVHHFGRGTRGFKAVDEFVELGDGGTAICVLPGTELAFAEPVKVWTYSYTDEVNTEQTYDTVARFRQINRDQQFMHHDALEFPNGEVILLNFLTVGQVATVLQMPCDKPLHFKEPVPAEEQERLAVVG